MIVETSALVAIARDEGDAGRLRVAIASSARPRVSAAAVLEAGIVCGARLQPVLDLLVAQLDVVPFDQAQALVARDAYLRFGKGSGSQARLTFGDCFSYALAMTTGEPLLFKGDDFTHTDVVPAV